MSIEASSLGTMSRRPCRALDSRKLLAELLLRSEKEFFLKTRFASILLVGVLLLTFLPFLFVVVPLIFEMRSHMTENTNFSINILNTLMKAEAKGIKLALETEANGLASDGAIAVVIENTMFSPSVVGKFRKLAKRNPLVLGNSLVTDSLDCVVSFPEETCKSALNKIPKTFESLREGVKNVTEGISYALIDFKGIEGFEKETKGESGKLLILATRQGGRDKSDKSKAFVLTYIAMDSIYKFISKQIENPYTISFEKNIPTEQLSSLIVKADTVSFGET
jgi:hypothetical protein